MKVLKKTILLIMLLLMLIGSTLSVSAGTTLLSASSNGQNFKKSWTCDKSSKNTRHHLTYGYDTFLINEDFAYANSIGWRHRSKIVNGKGTFYGPKKWADDGWSDKEVRHNKKSGVSIKYYCMGIK